MYHPPSSSSGQETDSIFIEQFLDLVEELVCLHKDLVIHINDPSATDANIFIDALSALGFTQIVTKVTHKKGNTSDFIFLEQVAESKYEVNYFNFLSYHLWVSCILKSKQKPKAMRKVKSRKLVENVDVLLKNEYKEQELLSINEMELLISEFRVELKQLYIIAPEK